MTAAEQFAALHPCARARLRWHVANPAPLDAALDGLEALEDRIGGGRDPGILGAVMAAAHRRRDRLEDAYRRLIE